MFNAQKVYHGCLTKNKDGTNRLVEKNKTCICPTNKPFWKYREDVSSRVKSRAQEKNQKKISTTLFDQYAKQKDIQRWLEADDSELVFLKESDDIYVVP